MLKSPKNLQSLKKNCTEFTFPEFPSLNLQSLTQKTLNFLTISAAFRRSLSRQSKSRVYWKTKGLKPKSSTLTAKFGDKQRTSQLSFYKITAIYTDLGVDLTTLGEIKLSRLYNHWAIYHLFFEFRCYSRAVKWSLCVRQRLLWSHLFTVNEK